MLLRPFVLEGVIIAVLEGVIIAETNNNFFFLFWHCMESLYKLNDGILSYMDAI